MVKSKTEPAKAGMGGGGVAGRVLEMAALTLAGRGPGGWAALVEHRPTGGARRVEGGARLIFHQMPIALNALNTNQL